LRAAETEKLRQLPGGAGQARRGERERRVFTLWDDAVPSLPWARSRRLGLAVREGGN
jgi:hypothetical protein